MIQVQKRRSGYAVWDPRRDHHVRVTLTRARACRGRVWEVWVLQDGLTTTAPEAGFEVLSDRGGDLACRLAWAAAKDLARGDAGMRK